MLRSKPSLYNLPVVDLSPPQAKVINSQLTIILSKLPKALKKMESQNLFESQLFITCNNSIVRRFQGYKTTLD